VNCFTGPNEIEVTVNRIFEATYDPVLMKTAEERQKAALAALKRERDGSAAVSALKTLGEKAKDETVNLMPFICDCVENDATLQEICDVMRDVFGIAEPMKL